MLRSWLQFHDRSEFLESWREVPVARAALSVSWVGLTSFASRLYHAMSREGVKERKECFSQGQKKVKPQMRGKKQT